MKVLITGGCGFIGSNLIRKMISLEKEVTLRVVDNLSVGEAENLQDICELEVVRPGAGVCSWGKRLQIHVVDIRDTREAVRVCEGADAIVHLAAATGVLPSIDNPLDDFESNALGTLNYLDAARLNGSRRFIFASSGAPLGEQAPPINEEMVPRPLSPYGASKLSGEAYCSAYCGSFNLETVCLRFGNVYGPNSIHKGSVVAKFIRHILAGEDLTIYGDGSQTRDFIYIDDLVEAILLSLEKRGIGGEIFQIATFKEHTVIEVAELLNEFSQKYVGRKVGIHFENERQGEILRNYSDISKARKMLGFEPKWSLERGLKATFEWFIENKDSGNRHGKTLL